MPIKNQNAIEEDIILEILQVIEKYNVSAYDAEQIPEKLKSAIGLNNMLQMCEVSFKRLESLEQ